MRANYKVEFASGVFLLLGIAALIWLATRATDYGQELGKETYTISARFTNIGDLRDRAPVKIGGVTVGMVESVELDPVTFEAIVHMKVSSRFNEIPSDTGASVFTSGVLGDRYIGLEPGGAPDMLTNGDELFITQSALVLEQIIGKYLFNAGSDKEE
ncbi:MAG: outer membrane lipid asymmetry maintenance protein MlaD [Xanthomonadales bacterium]|jgi:phospholipid/cholesterol/gamma-HCH transport system substrate-binding protein|nr:outer membrane lipid asymmetry maintenance protein MlaD [Xanthomonadales bacterium]MDH3922965.1 outer membrane lipid asymmetry maintenance protein MlaD [Xanthomonadales bacterium]MDH3940228.1 outer membrane lipid asymmetry maintenance protein MlaD [Xanthomonadales bacterium]MDH3999673.1 outer membrane lipid asymmetry maintenance protein MlaD [Xanthomonadales bacterium]